MPNISKQEYVELFKTVLKLQVTNVAGATQSIPLPPVPAGLFWFLERYTVFSNSAATPEVFAYDAQEGNQPTDLFDYSVSGRRDTSDNVRPAFLQSGAVAVFRWTGLNVGDLVAVRVQISVRMAIPVTIPDSFDLTEENLIGEVPMVGAGI